MLNQSQYYCDTYSISYSDIPIPFRVEPFSDSEICPKCKIAGIWRTGGPEYEEQLRCAKCYLTWNPLQVRFLQSILKDV